MHSLTACALATCAASLLAWGAGAATFTVNSTADTSDGACTVAASGCTLREAIEEAVATPGRDTIRFAATAFPVDMPGAITLTTAFPTIADVAGTVLDGAGAGVIVQAGAGPGPPTEGLIFAGAADAPLRKPTIANVTVRGFTGNGITICGGEFPGCDEDVSEAVVENVVATGNGGAGIRIHGRNVTKTRVTASVVSGNGGDGFDCASSQGLAGTRIDRLAASDNGGIGIHLFSNGTGSDNAIANSFAARSAQHGISFTGEEGLVKTKLTNVNAVENGLGGIVVGASGGASVSISAANASYNTGGAGLWIFRPEAPTSLVDVVVISNLRGIEVSSVLPIGGIAITNAKAVFNSEDGIRLESTTTLVGNRVTKAFVVGNGIHGLHLVAARADGNVVSGVHAVRNNGSGIVLEAAAGAGNAIADSRVSANVVDGIAIGAGSTLNVLERNTVLVSESTDLVDANAACVNTWAENVFETSAGPCIH